MCVWDTNTFYPIWEKQKIAKEMTFGKDTRTHQIKARLTEKEYIQFREHMAKLDYLSESNYIRDRVLHKQLEVRKNITLTDRNLRNQINALTAAVSKIGVDYNQATKRFNSLAKQTRPDGSPVINARAANYYLSQLHLLTRQVIAELHTVVEIVSRLDYDNRPHGEVNKKPNKT